MTNPNQPAPLQPKRFNGKLRDKDYRLLRREVRKLIEVYGMADVVQVVHVLAIVDFENRRKP